MTRPRRDDDGFGLVEVIVAMAILGLLAIAVLPLIWTGLDVAAKQSNVATATRIAASAIELARANPPEDCTLMSKTDTEPTERATFEVIEEVTVGDIESHDLEADDCVRPGTLRYTVTVKVEGTEKSLATVSTLIFLPELAPAPAP